MNKYKEALNRVKKAIIIALACQGIDLKKDNETVLALKTLQELINEHEKLKEENQKLKDKETPKKPISKRLYYNCHNGECDKTFIHYCPVCHFYSVDKDYANYCPNCAQKLDWSDSDE